MAKEPNICPYCHLVITSSQNKVTTTTGVHYHKECFTTLGIDAWVAAIEKKHPTTDTKLARIISQNNELLDTAKKQEGSLNTIKSIIVVFVVLSIIGVLIQSCGVLGF